MVIVLLMGGLGNQMFQYAAGRAVAVHYKTNLKIDTSFLESRKEWGEHTIFRNFDLDIFNIAAEQATNDEIAKLKNWSSNQFIDRLARGLFGPKKTHLKQPDHNYYPKFLQHGADVYMQGYWQSEKFFSAIESVIRRDFTFKNQLSEKGKLLMQQISNNNAVCVNVRRGDFVTNPMHGTMNTDYYKRSASFIESKITDPHYFIFSDDLDWCRENLRFNAPSFFVDHSYAGEKFGEYLQLMIACKHFVIPNSSFAWWAAWLNTNPEKIVIAPQKWFGNGPQETSDLIPERWVKM